MIRKRNSNFIIFIIIALFCITIGYAALSSTLNINGKSSISKNTWDVYFDNVQVKDGSVEAVKIPKVTDKTTVDFEVALNMPGDFYEFNVDVVNNGTIDAMIESVVKEPELTDAQKKYLNYIIEYENGEQIASKQLVKKEEFVRLKVRVELRKDIDSSDLPEVGDVLYLGFTVNYVQADNTAVGVPDNGVYKLISASGDINEIGTIVTIGDQQFYTIGTEGDNVKLLSVNNITISDTPIQSDSAGETLYASSSHQGKNFTDYNGSLVEFYVNNYKNVLESFGVEIISARVITYEELIDSNTFNCYYEYCSEEYSWIYSTSYWTSSPEWYDSEHENLFIISSGTGLYGTSEAMSAIGVKNGVRPVIIISKEYFK